jgi:hypothetical protein
MTCADADTLLDLTRPDELTAAETAALDAHCASCSRCAALRDDAQRLSVVITAARAETQREADVLLRSTAAAARTSRVRRASWSPVSLRRPAPLGARALALRGVALALPTLLLGLLWYQSFRDARLMDDLEQRLQAQGHGHSAAVEQAASFDPLRVLSSLRGRESETFARRLIRLYPDLARVTLDDGLSADERAIVRLNAPRFLHDIDSLLVQGDTSHVR